MNDGIDTLRDNNDIAPFKNILNEMYSKDISKKVHSSYLLKAQKGHADDFLVYAVSIDKLEQETGIDFFCNLPNEIEKTVEATYSADDWAW